MTVILWLPIKTRDSQTSFHCFTNPRTPMNTCLFCLCLDKKCEALTVPFCLHDPHFKFNMTQLPNFFKHYSQSEATTEMNKFMPLVRYNCSSYLASFLCSLYAPPCNGPQKPCRELCNRVEKGCGSVLKEYGLSWPKTMTCEKFPLRGSDEVCFDTIKTPTTTVKAPLPKGEYFLLISPLKLWCPIHLIERFPSDCWKWLRNWDCYALWLP